MIIASSLSQKSSQILSQLTQAYGFDLFDFNSKIYLKLDQKNYDSLLIERDEPNVVRMSHCFVLNNKLISSPAVTFLLKPTTNNSQLEIFPLNFTASVFNIFNEVAFLADNRSEIRFFETEPMAKVAMFSNAWLSKIQAQSWFLPPAQPNPIVSVSSNK